MENVPVPAAAPVAAPETGLIETIIPAIEEGLSGITDPTEAAALLRELADMIEGGEGAPAPAPTPMAGGAMPPEVVEEVVEPVA